MSRIWSLFRSYKQWNNYKYNAKRIFLRPSCNVLNRSNFFSTGIDDNSQDAPKFDITELAGGDETLKKKLQVLLLEVDVWRQEGGHVPSVLKPEEWKELSKLESVNARRKYLMFLWKKNIKKENKKLKKSERSKNEDEDGKEREMPEYRLGGNAIFMRFGETQIMNFYNARLIQALQFGQSVVVDCGFDNDMTVREQINCAKQLMILFSKNRVHSDPFNLHFCSVNWEGRTMKDFLKIVPTARERYFPLNLTEKSYLDLFPKKQLVYLTPHCREELVNFDHNAVYIIGGIVDKHNGQPFTLGRAKEQGLKMAKLPLDRYLCFSSGGGKSLTLDQVMSILLDIRHTGNWNVALQHVPRRKLLREYDVDYSAKKFKLLSEKVERFPKTSVSSKIKSFGN